MITWFLANASVTLCTWLFLGLNRTSPHRLRFLVCFASLCAWLVPWQLVGMFLPNVAAPGLAPVQAIISEIPNAGGLVQRAFGPRDAGELSVLAFSYGSYSLIDVLIILAGVAGLGTFLLKLYLHYRLIGLLEKSSRSGAFLWTTLATAMGHQSGAENIAIRIQNEFPGAMTSGILAPKIWLHEDLVEDPNLPAVLLHEARHVHYRDNAYLLVITFIGMLFWWNPLVRILAAQSRNLQELGCDESCVARLPDYRRMLSSLVLAQARSSRRIKSPALGSSIFGDFNFNVRRIKLLERTYVMKTKHFIATILTVVTAFFAVSFVAAQSEQFTLEELGSSLSGSGMAGRVVDGTMENVRYQIMINENATISAYYPDAYLIDVVSSLVDNVKRLEVPRNIDKVTNEAVEDPTYALRLDVSEQLALSAWRADDKAAYGVSLAGGFRNLSLQDTLDRLSQESACDVFREDGVIVMDNCR